VQALLVVSVLEVGVVHPERIVADELGIVARSLDLETLTA
jgi:hypothetical protein